MNGGPFYESSFIFLFKFKLLKMPQINVNDQYFDFELEEGMPLLWVIRDLIGLTGTKFACGKGICGSCSVLIDGLSVRSCIIPVETVLDKKITTIEGLHTVHPEIQKVWDEENVPQCGFCQPGQLVSATALLLKNEHPTEEEINKAMSGNICRCGTYVRIRKAIHKAANLNFVKDEAQ